MIGSRAAGPKNDEMGSDLRGRKKAPNGFTRCDLSAVLVVLTLSSMLSFAGLGQRTLRRTDCPDNMRRLGVASQIYSLDNYDHLPGCQHSPPSWISGLAPYCSPNVYTCPNACSTDSRFSFALNDFLTPRPHGAKHLNYTKLNGIPAPGGTVLFAEAQPYYLLLELDHFHFADAHENGFTPARFREQVAVQRHRDGANYLFPDGHLEPLSWKVVQTRLSTPKSLFVHPEGASSAEYSEVNPNLIVAR